MTETAGVSRPGSALGATPAGAEDLPVVICVAPNGATRTMIDHPSIPLTVPSLIETAVACHAAGAAMISLSVRDADHRHVLDAGLYREVIGGIRESLGDSMVVQMATETLGLYDRPSQIAAVRETRPESVSIGLREFIADPSDLQDAAEFLEELHFADVMTQFILHSPADVALFREMRRRGVIPGERAFAQFVLGAPDADKECSTWDLLPFLAAWMRDGGPEGLGLDLWSVAAYGRREGVCVLAAAAMGGHMRVGFETNIYLSDGATVPDNAALVRQAAAGAAVIGRKIASADHLRALWRPDTY